MRIQILTAGFGDGHNTAARNVAKALEIVSGGAARCPVDDAIAAGNPLSAGLLRQAYQLAITTFPGVWRVIYRQAERIDVTKAPLELFNGVLDWLDKTLGEENPAAVVSSFPLYASLVRRLDSRIPLFTVVTDSISVHRSWAATHSDLHFVTDPHSKSVFQSLGVPPESIVVSGFPVSPEFARLRCGRRRELNRLLWLVSTTTRNSVKTLRSLLSSMPKEVAITIVLGRHASRLSAPFEKELARCTGSRDVLVQMLGWHENVPGLMAEHDFLITKAGGASIHEAFAAALPAGINYVVPGQEEGNAQLSVERGCGVMLDCPGKTGPAICNLVTSGRFEEMAGNAARRCINDGAFRIARAILEVLTPSGPVALDPLDPLDPSPVPPAHSSSNLHRARELASRRPARISSTTSQSGS